MMLLETTLLTTFLLILNGQTLTTSIATETSLMTSRDSATCLNSSVTFMLRIFTTCPLLMQVLHSDLGATTPTMTQALSRTSSSKQASINKMKASWAWYGPMKSTMLIGTTQEQAHGGRVGSSPFGMMSTSMDSGSI